MDGSGVIKDGTFRQFFGWLDRHDGMTESVLDNCGKWLQKELNRQLNQKLRPEVKAYVVNLPGVKEVKAKYKQRRSLQGKLVFRDLQAGTSDQDVPPDKRLNMAVALLNCEVTALSPLMCFGAQHNCSRLAS